jgi:hypothetical protein
MNSTDPCKNEVAFVIATISLAVCAGGTSLCFVRRTALSFNVMFGVAGTVAIVIYVAGILWGIHEDGKRRR